MKFITILISMILILNVKCDQNKDEMVYTKASIPTQIYRCIQRFNLLRCLKYFVLLRLEARDLSLAPSNTTNEFLANILKNVRNLPSEIPENITRLNDDDLNERLTMGFQKFFYDRPIKLHFIPNMLVKLVPSSGSDLEISLKRTVPAVHDSSRGLSKDEEIENDDYESYDYGKVDEDESNKEVDGDDKKDEAMKDSNGLRKKRGYYLQLGVPLLLAPYMVFAGFLPMLIPVLKLATAFTTIVNVTALIASIMYLARQHALEREMQQTVYFNPGYKERK